MRQYKIQISFLHGLGISFEYESRQSIIITFVCIKIYLGFSEYATGYSIFGKYIGVNR
jgi:hypothetical protein